MEDDSFNIIEYLYFYNGGGVAVGDINNDGFPDIYFSANRQPNRLFLNLGKDDEGKIHFQDITESAGVAGLGNWSTGVTMVDVNGDGWLDIYQCVVGNYKNFKGHNQLFINNGCLGDSSNQNDPCQITFTDQAKLYGIDHSGFSTQAAFFDYDLDGDLDLYLLCHSVHSTETYRDTTTTRLRNPLAGDKLFENKMGETRPDQPIFEDVSEAAGIIGGIAGYGLGIAISDLDNNGYPDIYVGNDFHENDFLYFNQGNGKFIEKSKMTLGHTSYFSMGNDLADINNDGRIDIITLDMKPENESIYKSGEGPDPFDIYRFKRDFGYHHQFPQNMLHMNRGAGINGEIRFSEKANMMGVSATDWSWSALIADYDNDGWKDLYITNGIPRRPNDLDYLKFIANKEIQEYASDLELVEQMPDGKISNFAFVNHQGEKFEDVTHRWGLSIPSVSNGAAYADFDLDGDLDLVVNNLNDFAVYFENMSDQYSNNKYLKVRFKGPAKNQLGVGTKVTIYTGGEKQFQELYVSRGWQSGVDHTLHFGTGTVEVIDSLLVTWFDGKQEILKSIETNQTLLFDYLNAVAKSVDKEKPAKPLFQDSSHKLAPSYSHRENRFYDSTREPLIPYLLSTQGPKIAVADVNGDQLEDFFIGGSSGQAGALYLQNQDGTFDFAENKAFLNDALCEDTGVAFFDADQDGDMDLYIGSGGNQFFRQDTSLLDRLYINDGRGNFVKSAQSLPKTFNQTSCVRPFDFDGDGDTDLFVGSRSVAFYYGRSPESYLLINDGKGNFSEASSDLIDLSNLGMVTDAAWADIDRDQDLDLVLTGDWMPVTIFKNEQHKFTRTKASPISGWWNCIIASDIDRDGDMDLIIGNFGTNSNLHPSLNEPVKLYIGDFDKNLTPDPVLTYFRHGTEYPVMSLDALSGQMVFLKKKYRSYVDFSTKPVTEIFSSDQLRDAQVLQVTSFRSSIAINDGQGNFEFRDLPPDAQISSTHSIVVFDFNRDGNLDILLAGNSYDLTPTIGRLDASPGTLLLGQGNGEFKVADNAELNLMLEGQVRDLQIINTKENNYLLAGRNNLPLQCFTINPLP